MKREELNEILNKAKVNKNQFSAMENIESIMLKNGNAIYPNIKYTRFCFDDKNLYVLNGTSIPYGQAFGNRMRFSLDRKEVSFPREEALYQHNYKFRVPQPGDILRVANSREIITEVFVESVINSFNEFSVKCTNPITISKDGFQISYYDPKEYTRGVSIYLINEGIYLNFTPDFTKKSCPFGKYSYKIPIKKIRNIRLKEV